jgi:hypothetical protein
MTKLSYVDENLCKARSNSNLINHQNQRIRRTFSFINSNRKRAINYCTLKQLKRNRRLSLNQPKKHSLVDINITNDSKSHECLAENFCAPSLTENVKDFSSLTSITNQLRQYAEEFDSVDTNNASVKFSKFKRLKQKFHMNLGQNAKSKSQSLGYDQSLQDIIQKHKSRNLNIQVIYLNSV